jgi:glycosyltransferase involved in cell wall biosynthesis
LSSFSIVICTHNPDPELFQRLLSAVLKFEVASPTHEVIIVDNLSNPALSENEALKNFLKQKNQSRLIHESQPGLTPSRLAGIKEANHEWIVFFDDDNEPADDYLMQAAMITRQFPQVGAWGPGNVEVEYTIAVAPSWLHHYKHIFQQRNSTELRFDNIFWWQHCYPYGTGFLLQKNICKEYQRRVEQGMYSLSDRKGKSLSSGGDMQMIYTGLLMGYYIGISPDIKLKHLINSSKANQRYIGRLLYGSASCNLPAYYQCFPEKYQLITYPSAIDIMKKLYYFFKVLLMKEGFREFYFQLSRYLGELEGLILLEQSYKKPLFLKKLEQLLGLK